MEIAASVEQSAQQRHGSYGRSDAGRYACHGEAALGCMR
jgi:hypothetical protein